MSSDDDYLAHALPVLKTYTRQTVLSVDLDRLCRTAAHAGEDAPGWQFLTAMRDFVREIKEIEGLDL